MVSVALCTYNGEKYIYEQLQSIAAQTLLPGEVIICDDLSTDNTIAEIERFKTSKPPFSIQVYTNSSKAGITANFFRAISLCQGEFIALCDQDDVWLPEKLATMIEYFKRPGNEKIQVVFSDLLLVNEELEPLNRTMWQRLDFGEENRRKWESNSVEYILHAGNVVTGAATVIRSSFKERMSSFSSYPFKIILHDYAIALAAGLDHSIGYMEKPLVLYRQHTAQQLGARDFRLPFAKKLKLIKLLGSRQYNHKVLLSFREKLNELEATGVNEYNSEYYKLGLDHLRKRTSKAKSWFHKLALLTPEFTKGRYSTYVHSAVLGYLNDLLTRNTQLK
jgi:glycosyltransferase involved in cell wall biosynthesis